MGIMLAKMYTSEMIYERVKEKKWEKSMCSK